MKVYESKKINLVGDSDKPAMKFGEYKQDENKNNMFVGANGFPIDSLIPSNISGTFSRVVVDNE